MHSIKYKHMFVANGKWLATLKATCPPIGAQRFLSWLTYLRRSGGSSTIGLAVQVLREWDIDAGNRNIEERANPYRRMNHDFCVWYQRQISILQIDAISKNEVPPENLLLSQTHISTISVRCFEWVKSLNASNFLTRLIGINRKMARIAIEQTVNQSRQLIARARHTFLSHQ